MSKTITILFLLFCHNLNANDGFPEAKKSTLINSNRNDNSITLIQVKEPEKEKSTGDKFYQFLKDWSSSLIALTGFIGGYIIIRRKLVENHISKALMDIQDANKILLNEVTELIDQYSPKTYTVEYVWDDELIEIDSAIKRLFKLSQKADGNSQTTIFYLKFTIQQTIKNYRKKNPDAVITTRDIYGIILKTLSRVTFLSTQVVPIPDSIRTENKQWLNKKIQKYVTDSEFTEYRSFKQGLSYEPDSALYLLYYDDIRTISNNIFMRSAFQIYESTSAIAKILFIDEIYAPLVISATYSFEPKKVQSLFLIGYKENTIYDRDEGEFKMVTLIYSNPSDYMGFVDSVDRNRLIKNYHDDSIPNSGFSMENLKKVSRNNIETIEIQFKSDYLRSLYKPNKRQFKKNFPKIDGVVKKRLKRFFRKIRNTKWW